MELLHQAAHAALRQAAAAKHVGRVVGDLMRAPRRVRLEQPDGAGEDPALLRVAELRHLVRDVLEVRVQGLGVLDHAGELGADHGVADERGRAEEALVRPFEAFLRGVRAPSGTWVWVWVWVWG